MNRKYKRKRRPPEKYICTACGQNVTQDVGWSSCPHCNEMGKLVKVKD